jgi:hypothetical protein
VAAEGGAAVERVAGVGGMEVARLILKEEGVAGLYRYVGAVTAVTLLLLLFPMSIHIYIYIYIYIYICILYTPVAWSLRIQVTAAVFLSVALMYLFTETNIWPSMHASRTVHGVLHRLSGGLACQ